MSEENARRGVEESKVRCPQPTVGETLPSSRRVKCAGARKWARGKSAVACLESTVEDTVGGRASDFGLWTLDFGLWTGDWGLPGLGGGDL